MKSIAGIPKMFITVVIIALIAIVVFTFVIQGIKVLATLERVKLHELAIFLSRKVSMDDRIINEPYVIDINKCRKNYQSVVIDMNEITQGYGLRTDFEIVLNGNVVCGSSPQTGVVASSMPVFVNSKPGYITVILWEG